MSENLQTLSFTERLTLIRDAMIPKPVAGFPDSIFTAIESRLHITIPEPLKDVYRVLGNHMELLDAQYHIAMPDDLSVNGDVLVFAAESQFAHFYGIHLPTQTPVYLDYDNPVAEQLDQSLSDFLLFLLGLQCVGYARAVATVSPDAPYAAHLSLISDDADDGAIFCRPGQLLAVWAGEDVFLCARNKSVLETFAEETKLDLKFL